MTAVAELRLADVVAENRRLTRLADDQRRELAAARTDLAAAREVELHRNQLAGELKLVTGRLDTALKLVSRQQKEIARLVKATAQPGGLDPAAVADALQQLLDQPVIRHDAVAKVQQHLCGDPS